ncbi:MAG: DUF350 domain-containing protein [Aestuariibacter sp.]
MEALINLIPVSDDLWLFLVIDMAIAVFLMTMLRWISGRLMGDKDNQELVKHDNFAFGISVAGRMMALAIVLAVAVSNSISESLLGSVIGTLSYGLLGIFLIKVGRFAHDKFVLHRLDKEFHIRDRNMSIALVDASSSIATALIIQSVMAWAEGFDLNALLAILSGFVVSQAILLAMTRIYERRFAENNRSGSLQASLTKGQMALAVQHSGHLLGTALAVTAAGDLLVYNPVGYVSNLTSWLIVGLALAMILAFLVILARRFILANVDLVQEIDQQHNVGVASIELALSVGIALILTGLIN